MLGYSIEGVVRGSMSSSFLMAESLKGKPRAAFEEGKTANKHYY